MVVEGYPNKGIAQRLAVSERTIKAHRQSIMQKNEKEAEIDDDPLKLEKLIVVWIAENGYKNYYPKDDPEECHGSGVTKLMGVYIAGYDPKVYPSEVNLSNGESHEGGGNF